MVGCEVQHSFQNTTIGWTSKTEMLETVLPCPSKKVRSQQEVHIKIGATKWLSHSRPTLSRICNGAQNFKSF